MEQKMAFYLLCGSNKGRSSHVKGLIDNLSPGLTKDEQPKNRNI
jgi:hypothetical protein